MLNIERPFLAPISLESDDKSSFVLPSRGFKLIGIRFYTYEGEEGMSRREAQCLVVLSFLNGDILSFHMLVALQHFLVLFLVPKKSKKLKQNQLVQIHDNRIKYYYENLPTSHVLPHTLRTL